MSNVNKNLLLIKSIIDNIKNYENSTWIEKFQELKASGMPMIENNKNLILAQLPMDATIASLIESEYNHFESFNRANTADKQQFLDFCKSIDFKKDAVLFKQELVEFTTQLMSECCYHYQLSHVIYQELVS